MTDNRIAEDNRELERKRDQVKRRKKIQRAASSAGGKSNQHPSSPSVVRELHGRRVHTDKGSVVPLGLVTLVKMSPRRAIVTCVLLHRSETCGPVSGELGR